MKVTYFVKITIISISLFFMNVPIVFSDVKVNGYHRKDGTYVKPHYRSDRDGLKNNNWTTQGNVNPHTGERGILEPDKFELQKPIHSLPFNNAHTYDLNDLTQ